MNRICQVSQVDYAKGLVKVRLEERGNIESNWLAMPDFEYDMPEIGEMAMVTFEENSYTTGFVSGGYYHKNNIPEYSGKNIYYKKFGGDLVIKYDSDAKKLEIKASEISIEGNIAINGNLSVEGTIKARQVIEE
jgi:phage baseplate assembly protein gpV